MKRNMLLVILQQLCMDSSQYYKPLSATNFSSSAACNNSLQLLHRYAKMKVFFNKLRIERDVIKALGIITGQDLRERILESMTVSNVAADQFRLKFKDDEQDNEQGGQNDE